MNESSSASSGERNAAHAAVRLFAAPLAIAAVGIAAGYGIGRSTQTASGEALLKEVFSEIRPVSFSGKIMEIDTEKKRLAVTVEGMSGVKLPALYQRKRFTLNADAKILARRTKDAKTFEQEFERLKTNNRPIEPPLPYTEQEIRIEELRVGEAVAVRVDSVGTKQTVLDSAFTAIQINVNR